jgi:two-component system, NtrC family, sensor kinase
MNALRNALLALAAAALIGALAFFYQRTQALDLRERNDVLTLLRELRDVDARWDIDVLRARADLGLDTWPPVNRAAAAKKTLASLRAAVAGADSPALNAGLGELASAVTEKADLIERYRAANTAAKKALGTAMGAADSAAEPGQKSDARAAELERALAQLAAVAPRYYWVTDEASQRALEAAATRVQSVAGPNAAGRDGAVQVEAAARELLTQRPAEQALFARLSYLTSGPRLDTLTAAFNSETEAILQDKERFRVYLIAYAAALLLGVGYLGARLKAANESLERRVIERTRELSEALQHLRESEAQLIQSEKMSSLGQMVAGVAHEINTPLAYVKNSLGAVSERLPALSAAIEQSDKLLVLLAAGGADGDELNRQFGRVSTQLAELKQQHVLQELTGLVSDGLYGTGQVAEIVGNLKDFSRLDRGKVTSFNLNDGLMNTLGLARHLLKSVTVNRKFGEIPAITCAPSQINQVFLNLITNAAQAIGSNAGEITITTRAEEGGVAVEIADTGGGIPPEIISKIFDPFFTTKEVGKGTGLGLSVSYKIVQQHGGRIEVDSTPGAGTRFTVWLPLEPAVEAELTA